MMSDQQVLQPTSTKDDVPIVRWVVAIALGACASAIAIHIEVLNVKAGGYLPRTLPKHGNPKWRWQPWEREDVWRSMLGPKDEQGKPVTRPLTPAEEEKMQRDMAHANAMNELRGAVEVGLWNYLLVPALLGVACSLLGKSRQRMSRYAVWSLLSLGLVLGGLMLYRGYFTSLGY
jgi:hypothetical protein